ncbi:histidine phosphatase family protein [Priestia koreensis]|uniref:phosphoglycerate mutase (2,3-diphosphoglycerate-dependent) n=1 Tax=Priestia koreensis TaxID=284581 RepID=A0A0M0LBW6_9BACI|nr:histidine phosphatase family protein [Priestia koreensis]KOO48178.1 phosphatase [Priestia koreensis]
MLNLYLVRHGQTEWNVQKRMQGWENSNLTELGKRNAIALGEKLKAVTFDAVYTSTSERTIETAKLIIGKRNLHIESDKNLREIFLGEWEGKTHEELKALYPEQYNNFWEQPADYKPFNGETFEEFNKRVILVLQNIISNHKEGNVLIVSHSVFLKSLMMHVKGKEVQELWTPPYVHDTSLTLLEIKDNTYKVVVEGDVTHLDSIKSI